MSWLLPDDDEDVPYGEYADHQVRQRQNEGEIGRARSGAPSTPTP